MPRIARKTRFLAPLYLLALLFLLAVPARADLGLSAKIGTLGPEVDVTAALSDVFNLRFTLAGFTYGYDRTVDNVKYEGDLKFFTLGGLLDIHPWRNNFRFSAGVMYNKNRFDAKATLDPGESYTIGGTDYPGALVGSIKGEVKFLEWAPYLGIGYGDAVGGDGRWHFAFDLGVLCHGEPEASLSAENPYGISALNDDLRKEEKKLQDELDGFRFYPVLAFGVSYKF